MSGFHVAHSVVWVSNGVCTEVTRRFPVVNLEIAPPGFSNRNEHRLRNPTLTSPINGNH